MEYGEDEVPCPDQPCDVKSESLVIAIGAWLEYARDTLESSIGPCVESDISRYETDVGLDSWTSSVQTTTAKTMGLILEWSTQEFSVF